MSLCQDKTQTSEERRSLAFVRCWPPAPVYSLDVDGNAVLATHQPPRPVLFVLVYVEEDDR
jgi:hypothetical protein